MVETELGVVTRTELIMAIAELDSLRSIEFVVLVLVLVLVLALVLVVMRMWPNHTFLILSLSGSTPPLKAAKGRVKPRGRGGHGGPLWGWGVDWGWMGDIWGDFGGEKGGKRGRKEDGRRRENFLAPFPSTSADELPKPSVNKV